MTYPIRRYPERQFRQIIINLRIPTHKARYKKINKLKHHSTGDLSIHVCNLRCVKSRVLNFLTHFVMVKWTIPLCYSQYTVPAPRRKQTVALTYALGDHWLGHVQLPNHTNHEKEKSVGKSFKWSAWWAVVMKPGKGKLLSWDGQLQTRQPSLVSYC